MTSWARAQKNTDTGGRIKVVNKGKSSGADLNRGGLGLRQNQWGLWDDSASGPWLWNRRNVGCVKRFCMGRSVAVKKKQAAYMGHMNLDISSLQCRISSSNPAEIGDAYYQASMDEIWAVLRPV
jgi:hypothetical protein